MRRVTIYSVAQACGVSSSTVSRAFSRPDLVNESVRQRILTTAAEMGYRPNRSARATATGRTGMIGLVVPDITNPFLPLLVRAVQRAAGLADWSVLLVDAEGDPTAESQLITQLQGQVDGLILASPRAHPVALREAIRDLPCVLINREIAGLASVICDNSAALASIGDHLLEMGHHRVALVGGPADSWVAAQRATTVRGWASRAGVILDDLGPFEASFDGGRAAGAALLTTDATAVFAFDDVMACGVLAELARRGVTVPGERSVVGCDDVLMARMVTPSLTTVTAPTDQLGSAAVDLLDRTIDEPRAGPENRTLPGTPALRESSGPPATP
ncbi:LacI family DNA-binding transcriptional regulator [Phytoactinopolyspora halophila]|uniref:LacI family DNA-binding transcriptional regulator n=1 Tax=Phytoactinopolyspora halophila TaxID=1981511 RepID=UPI000F4DF70F|nr:LacI family DNA-binding transcriptional regulator [Phytoactinopolyspora halophila]